MGFVLMILAAWLAVFAFFSMNKSLSVAENTFIFLFVLIIEINYSWIVGEELKDVALTKNGLGYAAFLVFRSILIPALYVILFNFIYRAKSLSLALLSAAACVGAIIGLHGVARLYDIERYTNWSLLYDAVYLILLEAVVFGLHRMIRKLRHVEVRRT